MSKQNSREQRRRWKDPAYRKHVTERISDSIRRRYLPKAPTSLSLEMRVFLHLLIDESIDILDLAVPVHRPPLNALGCVVLRLCDPKNEGYGMGQRYFGYAQRAGIHIYEFACWPRGQGLTVALIAGPSEEGGASVKVG